MAATRTRHVPIRTCVGCRQERPKRELVRVVRQPAGGVALDPTGKAPGRGAYLCRAEACLVAALRKGGLAGALRAPLTPADRAALEAAWTALPATANAATEPR